MVGLYRSCGVAFYLLGLVRLPSLRLPGFAPFSRFLLQPGLDPRYSKPPAGFRSHQSHFPNWISRSCLPGRKKKRSALFPLVI
ncbi:hypothetical protein BDP67DRAFT_499309 [Colletotrichum lupini]|nr:hypothetical protein BDP67DRAFT_499309 [Colletotrichum lupini]